MMTVFKSLLGGLGNFVGGFYVKLAFYALLFLVPPSVTFYEGYHLASRSCKAAELAAKVATLQRDLDAARWADANAKSEAATAAAENAQLQQEIKDYASHVTTSCPIPADQLVRLRRLGAH
jgi:hypothetical protein